MFQLKNQSKFLFAFLLVVFPIAFLKAEGEPLSWWERQKKKLPGWSTIKRYVVPVGIGVAGGVAQGLKSHEKIDDDQMKKNLASLPGPGSYLKNQLDNLTAVTPYERMLAAQLNKPNFKDVTFFKQFGDIEARVKYEGLRLFRYYRPLILSALAIGAYRLALNYWDKYQQQIKEAVEKAEKKK